MRPWRLCMPHSWRCTPAGAPVHLDQPLVLPVFLSAPSDIMALLPPILLYSAPVHDGGVALVTSVTVTLAVFTLAVSCAGDVMSCALQGGRPGLDDLSSLDAALHSNLLAVKTCPADQVEHLCLTFAAEQQLLGKVRTSACIYIATIYTLLCFTNHQWASLALLQQTAQACT